MASFFVGIDVSKDSFSFAVCDENGAAVHAEDSAMDHVGFDAFFAVMGRFEGALIGMESTSTYHLNLLLAIAQRGWKAYLVNPSLIKNFIASGSLRKTKTDRIDAAGIARFMLTHGAELRPFAPSAADALRELARRRESIAQEIARTKTDIKRRITLSFPELVAETNLFTSTGLALLEFFPSAQSVREMASAKRKKVFRSCGEIGLGRPSLLTYDRFVEIASSSVGVANDALHAVLADDVAALRGLRERDEIITEHLVEAVRAHDNEAVEILASIPGVGETTASHFIAEIGSVDRFETVEQLRAFAGTDPGIAQSGTMFKRKRIAKRGSPSLRRTAYLMTLGTMRCCAVFKNYYLKKRAEGMAAKKAMIATLNKLLSTIFSLLKHRRSFSLIYS
jgi:transposase